MIPDWQHLARELDSHEYPRPLYPAAEDKPRALYPAAEDKPRALYPAAEDKPRALYPAAEDKPRAAVAVVVRPGEAGAELLFIQRATVAGDPWSGQMAFPGGRREPADAGPADTAQRETGEELGLDLTPARFLGSLTDIDGGRATNRPIIVSARAWWLEGPQPQLDPNREVADALWVPFATLADPGRHIRYRYPPVDRDFPGIQLDQHHQVIWGLTLRFLADLFARLDVAFLDPS
jgi:8-oxo-dGTP pyrophosphatase MutT (NUDIX family)